MRSIVSPSLTLLGCYKRASISCEDGFQQSLLSWAGEVDILAICNGGSKEVRPTHGGCQPPQGVCEATTVRCSQRQRLQHVTSALEMWHDDIEIDFGMRGLPFSSPPFGGGSRSLRKRQPPLMTGLGSLVLSCESFILV